MKERLKMIFDRIDIFVVCIVFGCCLTVTEAYMGFWKGFAQCFVMTFLITEVCYTLRCNEKLKKELIEANWNQPIGRSPKRARSQTFMTC